LKLKCDEPLSNVAFKFNLRHYNLVGLSDIVLMLFQSKFTNAASMRATIPHGIREVGRGRSTVSKPPS
jgi:hypothetical protein